MGQSAPGDSEILARECSVLSRYLVELPADDRLTAAYAEFHRQRSSGSREASHFFDRCSLALLRSCPFGARFVDAYSSRFRRGGPAFEKLVLMLALLECRPESSAVLARPDPGGVARVISGLVVRGLADLLLLALSIAVLGPVHLLQRLSAREQPH